MRSLVIALTFLVAAPASAMAQTDVEASALPATVADERFELTMVSPKLVWTDKEVIEVGATLANLGEEPATIRHSGGEAVVFEVQALDGTGGTGWGYDAICGLSEFGPGGVRYYPYAKSGGWDPQGKPGTPFSGAWARQRELRLPVGTYRIIAHAQHGESFCEDIQSLEAALTIEIVEDWGPLAVVPKGATGDAVLGPGRLLRVGECMLFRADGAEDEVLLVWPADITEWRPKNQRIVMDEGRSGKVRLSNSDRLMIGGVPLTQDTPAEIERIRAALDASWVQPPDPSCPTEHIFHVGEVKKLD